MKPKIYYLTRSYAPYQKGGGPLIRTGTVKYLQDFGWDVVVVIPNFKTNNIDIQNNIWQIPFNKIYIQKISSLMEKIGVYEDYLDKWIDYAVLYLNNKITKNDIVFATSGGELGMIKLGSLLKENIGCKFIINFHDPLNYSLVHGLKVNKMFHVEREKTEKKYTSNSDLIITSSENYRLSLVEKYPEYEPKIINNYFGFLKLAELSKYTPKKSNKLRLAYSGSMLSDVQKPEILLDILAYIPKDFDIEIYFIGDKKVNKKLNNNVDNRIIFIDYLPHDQYIQFMCENIDIGFVSLCKEYYSACVPSKIYEYINLGLPIIGALPKGDAIDIINKNNFGFATHYGNLPQIANAIIKISNNDSLMNIRNNLLEKRKQWAMSERIKEVDTILQKLIMNTEL